MTQVGAAHEGNPCLELQGEALAPGPALLLDTSLVACTVKPTPEALTTALAGLRWLGVLSSFLLQEAARGCNCSQVGPTKPAAEMPQLLPC